MDPTALQVQYSGGQMLLEPLFSAGPILIVPRRGHQPATLFPQLKRVSLRSHTTGTRKTPAQTQSPLSARRAHRTWKRRQRAVFFSGGEPGNRHRSCPPITDAVKHSSHRPHCPSRPRRTGNPSAAAQPNKRCLLLICSYPSLRPMGNQARLSACLSKASVGEPWVSIVCMCSAAAASRPWRRDRMTRATICSLAYRPRRWRRVTGG